MDRYTSVFEQSLMLEPDGEYVLYKDAQQAIATARAEARREAEVSYKADADRLAEENATIRQALIGSTRWMEEWNERWRFLNVKARLEFCFEMNRLLNQARAALAAHEEGKNG
jgi:hypothetical protein